MLTPIGRPWKAQGEQHEAIQTSNQGNQLLQPRMCCAAVLTPSEGTFVVVLKGNRRVLDFPASGDPSCCRRPGSRSHAPQPGFDEPGGPVSVRIAWIRFWWLGSEGTSQKETYLLGVPEKKGHTHLFILCWRGVPCLPMETNNMVYQVVGLCWIFQIGFVHFWFPKSTSKHDVPLVSPGPKNTESLGRAKEANRHFINVCRWIEFATVKITLPPVNMEPGRGCLKTIFLKETPYQVRC